MIKVEQVNKRLKKSDLKVYRDKGRVLRTEDGKEILIGVWKDLPLTDGLMTVCDGCYGMYVSILDRNRVMVYQYFYKAHDTNVYDLMDDIMDDDDLYATCNVCGERAPIEQIHDLDGEYICDDCFNENYFTCDICGAIERIDDEHWDDDREASICDDCWDEYYIECCDCGEYHHRDNMTEIYNGDYVCDDCLYNYERCEDCGEYYPRDEVYYCDNDGGYYCNNCMEGHCDIIEYHSYSKAYIPQKLNDQDNSRHYGIELETENNTETARYVNEFGRLHCEHDGSLNDGYEIISQPLSIKLWYKWDAFKDLTEYLIKEGVRSHDTTTCGLHIHADRDQINNVDRVVAIVEMFREPLEILARRKNNQYANFISSNAPYTDMKVLKKYIKDGFYDGTRYRAVNTCNNNTIEFRFFRGTLNHSTIMASIELVDNIIEIANSSQTIIRLSDLLKGKYLPKYAKKRGVNPDLKIDLSEFINLETKKGDSLNVCYSL